MTPRYMRRTYGPMVWGVVVALAIVLALGLGVQRYGASEYRRGLSAAKAGARFDSVLVARVVQARSAAVAKTDTVVQRIRTIVYRTDTVVKGIPDSLIASPQVAALIAHTVTLSATTDSLVTAFDAEREAQTMRLHVMEAELAYHRVELRESEHIADGLRKRPTRAAAVVWAGIVGLVGFAAGVAR